MEVKKKPFFVCFFAKTSEHTISEIDGFFPIFRRFPTILLISRKNIFFHPENCNKIMLQYFFAKSVFSVN